MRPSSSFRDPRSIAARVVGLLGVADIAMSGLAPRLAPAVFLPLAWIGGQVAAFACGCSLLVLAAGLRRGLCSAWLLTIVALAQAVLASPVNHDELALLPLVPLALLLVRGSHFGVRPRCPRLGVSAILAGSMLTWVLGSAIHHGHVRSALAHVARAAGSGAHLRATHALLAHAPQLWPYLPLTGLASLLLLWGLYGLTVPSLDAPDAARPVRVRARMLFEQQGSNPLGYFATTEDKCLWDDPDGRGVVAYRVIGTTALVAGDPLTAPSDLPGVVESYVGYCRNHGWTPAFYQALPNTLPVYRALGFRAFAIGREAVIDLPTFTLQGKRIANVRHSVTHAERSGLSVGLYRAQDVDARTRTDLLAISQEWLATKAGGELGFTMGRLGPDGSPMPRSRVAIAYDRDNRPQAFITLIPAGSGRGWTLDLMRRRRNAESGTMDLLITRTAEALRDEGWAIFSLSLVPMASGEEDDEDAPTVARRARATLYHWIDGLYSYRSLFNYKRKFGVRWETRYLVYAGNMALPSAIYATARAHMPVRGVRGSGSRDPLPADRGVA
jgi:phosphatidylglycerol lysyltransferase